MALHVRFTNDWFHRLRVAFDGEHDCLLLDPVGAAGDDGKDLAAVGEIQPDGKGPVGFEPHGFALERHVGVRIGDPVDDQFGVDVEGELAAAAVQVLCRNRNG